MKDRFWRIVNGTVILFFIWPLGIILGLIFENRCKKGVFRIVNKDRLDAIRGGTILLGNHPSAIDPILMAALVFRKYLWHPLKYCPRIVADENMFYRRWFMILLRPIMIPVARGDKRKAAVSFIRIKRALEEGKVVIIFPEGGRTFRGDDNSSHFSHKKGRKLRELEDGVAALATKTGAPIIPVWIDGTDEIAPPSKHRLLNGLRWGRFRREDAVVMTVGKPFILSADLSRGVATQKIVFALLKLADE